MGASFHKEERQLYTKIYSNEKLFITNSAAPALGIAKKYWRYVSPVPL